MIRRAGVEDAEYLNDLLAREMGAVADFTPVLSNALNVCLIVGDGAAFFVWHGPGIYEVHCCFTQRGREVRELSQDILETMRREHGARFIWAAIPNESRNVKAYVRWLGFKPVGPITLPHGECELFTLENK